jgi:hypothetical protein
MMCKWGHMNNYHHSHQLSQEELQASSTRSKEHLVQDMDFISQISALACSRSPTHCWYCWRIKLISTYDPQAYVPTPFSPRRFPRFLSIRGARGLQAFDLALLLTYPNPNLRLI